MMMGYWNDGMSWGGWPGMTLVMVIFWGLALWGIVALIRYLNTSKTRDLSPGQGGLTPDSILAERFAKGEIDDKEYARRRVLLRPTNQSADAAEIDNTSREREASSVAR